MTGNALNDGKAAVGEEEAGLVDVEEVVSVTAAGEAVEVDPDGTMVLAIDRGLAPGLRHEEGTHLPNDTDPVRGQERVHRRRDEGRGHLLALPADHAPLHVVSIGPLHAKAIALHREHRPPVVQDGSTVPAGPGRALLVFVRRLAKLASLPDLYQDPVRRHPYMKDGARHGEVHLLSARPPEQVASTSKEPPIVPHDVAPRPLVDGLHQTEAYRAPGLHLGDIVMGGLLVIGRPGTEAARVRCARLPRKDVEAPGVHVTVDRHRPTNGPERTP